MALSEDRKDFALIDIPRGFHSYLIISSAAGR